MKRIIIQSGSHFEPLRGYSRAVVIGDKLYVSGTNALQKSGDVVGVHSAYEQAKYSLDKIKSVLASAHFELKDVVRTRMYVTNLAKWDEYAQAHREVFGEIRPASAIVQVTRLVDPRLIVEIEVEAVRGAESFEIVSIE